jgi:hypothetical protein
MDAGSPPPEQLSPSRRVRRAARGGLDDLDFALRLRALPPRIALLQLRARIRARRTGDVFSLASATRPPDLARLLELAAGRRFVVELGTGSAWTTIALAAADRSREVVSFDPADRTERLRYLALVDAQTRARIELVPERGANGPRSSRPVEMLYVDSSHGLQDTLDELGAWTPALAAGAIVVLDDYRNEQYPGVAEAVQRLGLSGEPVGTMFVHHHTR